MQTLGQLSSRILVLLALGSASIAITGWSLPCAALSELSEPSRTENKLFIQELSFDLGDEEANKVAESATKLRIGEEFKRDRIQSDLSKIVAEVSKYREAHKPQNYDPDWKENLLAKLHASGDSGVGVTIQSSLRESAKYVVQQPLTKWQVSNGKLPKDQWCVGNYKQPLFEWSAGNSTKSSLPLLPAATTTFLTPASNINSTSKDQHRKLEEFLEGTSNCFPGFDGF